MEVLRDHTHCELTDEKNPENCRNLSYLVRGKVESVKYEDVPGFCKAATLDGIKKHDYILTPGCYIGFEEIEDDDEEFEEIWKG
jgi:type I restriction enzyme M protein